MSASRSSRGAASALAALLLALPARGQGPQLPETDAVRAALAACAERRPEELAAALVELGPAAVPALLLELAAAPHEAARRRAALRLALEPRPQAWRAALVELAAREPAPPREALLAALAELGRAPDVALALGLAAGEPLEPQRDAALRDVLAAILARDPAAWSALWQAWESAPPLLRPALLRVAGDSGRSEGLELLADHLHLRQGHALLALQAIGRCARARPAGGRDRALPVVRALLDAPEPALRREAAIALGHLEDELSLGQLTALLRDRDGAVRASAHWALKAITGLGFQAEAERWSAWLAVEQAWWRRRGPGLLAAVSGGTRQEAVAALNELVVHRHPRHELAAELGAALLASEEELALLGCAALAQLGSAAALPALDELVARGDGALAAAALAARQACAGAPEAVDSRR